MSLAPINQEQVQQALQVGLAYLESPENSTPNNMLEGIVSCKSLFRGILSGALVVCQKQEDALKPTQAMKDRILRKTAEPELETLKDNGPTEQPKAAAPLDDPEPELDYQGEGGGEQQDEAA